MPATGNFAAQVEAWTAKSERALAEVVRESARGAAEILTDRAKIPVVTGNLRNSLAASLSGPPRIDWTKGHRFTDLSEVASVLKAAEPGHTIFLGFRAPYAERVEFGKSGGFWRLTIQRWPAIVAEAVKRVRVGT